MRILALAMVLVSMGCGVSIEPPYLLNELKVLAIVAEPPEIGPGDTAALRAYIAAPNNPNGPITASWTFCRENNASQTNTGCSDPVMLSQDAPANVAQGVFTVSAAFTADANLTANIPAILMDAGFWVEISLSVNAPSQRTFQAVKRVVVSSGKYPRNTNPVLRKVDVWDAGALTSVPHTVHVQDTIELVPDYDQNAFQQYQVLNTDGTWSTVSESAGFTWSVSQGQVNVYQTTGNSTVLWALPDNNQTKNSLQTFAVVLRDGRGGTAVDVTDIQVVP